MAPVGEFADSWYPGFRPDPDRAPWIVEPFRLFRPEDAQRFWLLDFHWPQGLTPLGLVWIEDGYAWGSQLAAELLPLPVGRGLAPRLAGTHVYVSAIEVTDQWEIAERTRRVEARLPAFVNAFEAIWGDRRDELERWWTHLSAADLSALSLSELGGYLVEARRYLKRSTEIHFGLMYPLLVNYLRFYRSCTQMDIDPRQIAKFLQGYDTKISETGQAMRRLADAARRAGLAGVFAAQPANELTDALSRYGGRASEWRTQFAETMRVFGHRAAGPFDVASPSWVEDSVPALAVIKSFLQTDSIPDPCDARRAAQAERAEAVDAARAVLTLQQQRMFDAGLASCQMANLSWWQDEHNYYIDLRAMLPMRWACLQVSDRVGADLPDDTLYLFWPELAAVLDGSRPFRSLRSLVQERRQYYAFWSKRRPAMPKWLGTAPESVADPILLEVFSLNRRFLGAMQDSAGAGDSGARDAAKMRGVPAAPGVARGIARVLFDPDELHRLEPGEILICESITPSSAFVFDSIAACVCDSGGVMSHAAIIGRNCHVPTVTSVGVATAVVHDGDEIEVDGTTGTVTILRSTRR